MSVTLHTSCGDLKLELFCELVPRHALNFLALCAMGAYDQTVFHRNIKGFLVAGGDTKSTGKGGMAWHGGTLDDEIVEQLKHDKRGIVSMANRGPNTAGSQFFILYAPSSHLNSVNTVFAQLIDGFDTLDRMEQINTDEKHRPLQPILLHAVTIHSNPLVG